MYHVCWYMDPSLGLCLTFFEANNCEVSDKPGDS